MSSYSATIDTGTMIIPPSVLLVFMFFLAALGIVAHVAMA
jgi:hypothetical protein